MTLGKDLIFFVIFQVYFYCQLDTVINYCFQKLSDSKDSMLSLIVSSNQEYEQESFGSVLSLTPAGFVFLYTTK